MDQWTDYIKRACTEGKPIVACLFGGINYLLFPDQAFQTAAYAVLICMVLDIFTKYVMLIKTNGGYLKAVRTRKISSRVLWEGTKIKIYSYLIVAILVGLSYRVAPLEQLGIFLGTVIYAVLFLREFQSVIENLCDTGAQLGWLLVWAKRKENQILEADEPKESDSNDA